MHKKTIRSALPRCLLSAMLVAGVATTASVRAVDGNPPGLFELEGNTLESGLLPGTDWGALHTGATPANMITFTSVLPDPAPSTIYTQGGSKDINDVTQWRHKNGSTPDKDDITNAYAAAFTNPTDVCVNGAGTVVACGPGTTVKHAAGDMIVYFGLDRYANSGDAFAGFWFFQQDVGPTTGGVFTGQHTPRVGTPGDPDYAPGDVLVLVEYPQASGSHPEVKVYEWDPADLDGDNVANNLDLLLTQSQAECTGSGGKLACAISNLTALSNEPPWDYTPKSGPATSLPFESFFEGGINITQILGATPCISSFLAETRASRSETATLKDFVAGNFDACGASVSKSCEAIINETGDEVNVGFTGSASNTGGLPLFVELQDDQPGSVITAVCNDVSGNGACGDASDTVPSDLNSLPANIASFSLGAGETVIYEGSYTVTEFNEQTEFTDEVTLTFFDDPDGPAIGSSQAEATCPPQGEAAIAVVKDCTASLVDGTTFSAAITGYAENTGNVKLVNVTLSDSVVSPANLTVVQDTNGNGLVDPGEPAFVSGSSLAPDAKLAFSATVTSSNSTSHTDTITAEGTNFFDSEDTASAQDTASCSLNLSPGLSLTKVCDEDIGGGSGVRLVVDGGQVVVEAGNIITVSNTGNEALDNVVIQDDQVAGLVKISGGANLTCTDKSGSTPAQCTGTLAIGDTVVFQQTYKPDGSSISGSLPLPSTVAFDNLASVTATGALTNTPLEASDDASCALCPPHTD